MPEEKKEDLKKEEEGKTSDVNGQGDKKLEGSKDEPNKLEELEKQLADEKEAREKAETDRDNYKDGMLSAKSKKFDLEGDDEPIPGQQPPAPAPSAPTNPTDEEKAWNEVEKRASDIADKKFEAKSKAEAKANGQIAIKKFLTDNPELVTNDAILQAVKGEYHNKHGKSVEGITLDLNRAYNLYKIDNGISVDKKEEVNTNPGNLANMPAGGGGAGDSKIDGFTEEQQKFMAEQSVTVEQFNATKAKIESGDFRVPADVEKIYLNK